MGLQTQPLQVPEFALTSFHVPMSESSSNYHCLGSETSTEEKGGQLAVPALERRTWPHEFQALEGFF